MTRPARRLADPRPLQHPAQQRRPVLEQAAIPGAALELGESDLLRVLEVVEEQRVHRRAEAGVERDEVRLVVERERPVVEVHRADRRPEAVDDLKYSKEIT